MSGKHHLLHTLKKKNEVRHLLLDLTAGAGAAKLSQLIGAVESPMGTGTQFNMEQKADALAQEWASKEGFKFVKEDHPAYDSLRNTVALAKALGYTIVYDPRHQNLKTRQRLNVTGAVPLTQWQGMAPKDYEFAVLGLKIVAHPKLPANHGLNMEPDTTEEFLEVMRKAVKLQDAIGPTVEFVLGGDD